jgi:hypothetical protein
MKRIFQLSQGVRVLLGALILLAGLVLTWALFGLDGFGLLALLPFAAFFIWVSPELWSGKR